MLEHAGYEISARGIAAWYTGIIDGIVIDDVDAALARDIEASGIAVCVTDTIMATPERKARLAQRCLDFCTTLGGGV
jgi:LPPG:FO 2-phospho-L-lactate transferase